MLEWYETNIVDDTRNVEDFNYSDFPKSVQNIPSIFDYKWTLSGTIAPISSSANIPSFPFLSSVKNHSMRLEACQSLSRELSNELKSLKYNVRDDYQYELERYADNLSKKQRHRNILLADAAMRTLRTLFSAEASILPPPFAARLKTLMEQHIGLRPFYPEIEEFYQDVRSGRLLAPLPLDAVEKFIEGVIAATPETFDPGVAAGIDEGTREVPSVSAADLPPADPEQPTPPADPLGELDPATSRNLQIAGVINKLWEVFSKGEVTRKSLDSWLKVYSYLSIHVRPIIQWLSQLVS